MIAARSWLLVMIAAAGVGPSPCPAAEPTRPVVATIHLDAGDSIAVAYVGPWSLDAIRYFTSGGEPGYLSTHKVGRIVSAAGANLTRFVVEDRKSIGESGEPPPSLVSWLTSPFRYESTRGRPHTIIEFAVLTRDGHSGVDGDGGIASAAIGGMAPLSPSWSLGGVVHVMGRLGDYRAFDAGVRIRRYIGARASVDATMGVFTADGRRWDTRGVPVYGEAAVTLVDAVSLVTRVERATWDGTVITQWNPVVQGFDDERTRTVWRTGVRVGPSPRWLSIPLFLIGCLAALPSGGEY